MTNFIQRVKNYTKRQNQSLNHALNECDSLLSYLLIGYKAVLFFLVIFPIIFLLGFMIGCILLSNPFVQGLDFLEELT